jgi:hypothetical protein
MTEGIRSAHTACVDTAEAAEALIAQLAGDAPLAIAFFCAAHHDGAALCRALMAAFPEAQVIGCTTAGELTEGVSTTGSVSLLALGQGKVRRAASALARFEHGVEVGVADATRRIASTLDVSLRALDPASWVGVVLVEGLRMHEEAANAALGNAAPLLSFVGGSAGDGGQFVATRVFCQGEECGDGAALLLLEAAVPFVVGKTCSFEPQSRSLTVTRADAATRVVYELDGRPVEEVYAEALGIPRQELDSRVFMRAPLGVMIDGAPWIRSPQRVLAEGGLKFYCQIPEGMEVQIMKSTDLVADTRAEVLRVRAALGGKLSGGLVFNCILRRLELDEGRQHEAFLGAFEGLSAAGFHTYGESFLAHINQTLLGLWFA